MVTNLLRGHVVTGLMMLVTLSNVEISSVVLLTRGGAHMYLVE